MKEALACGSHGGSENPIISVITPAGASAILLIDKIFLIHAIFQRLTK